MLRERQTVNHAGLSPHEMHCHQYLAILAAAYRETPPEVGSGGLNKGLMRLA